MFGAEFGVLAGIFLSDGLRRPHTKRALNACEHAAVSHAEPPPQGAAVGHLGHRHHGAVSHGVRRGACAQHPVAPSRVLDRCCCGSRRCVRRGGTLEELCAQVKKLPKRQLWRWAQAGDLPGDGVRIDAAALAQLTTANAGRNGFGYTHYDAHDPHNAAAIKAANDAGFVISLSADSLERADELAALGIAPVACVLPTGTTKPTRTPAGRHVAVCPATVRDDVTCASCGICAVPGHKAIIGFPAHGSGAKKAQTVFFRRRLEFA